MAYKRSRATFEADLQAQQSPYAIYGTPLPPLDPDTRDDGSYVPVWKQEVTDEQGRKRLHGAFTGGFSAGYFNTVGSKEGWTPSTFTSSRSNRSKDVPRPQQKPEDFMDEEDLAEAEEARKLQTTDVFAGLGSSTNEPKSNDSFMDLLRPTGETMGVKLLKKMGWREGQGIGPKVARKARTEDRHEGEIHLFAPDNSRMISFNRKTDKKGLGFEGEEGLTAPASRAEEPGHKGRNGEAAEEMPFGTLSNGHKAKKKKAERKGGFGVGILNDNGSDEEDPYAVGPSISYSRVVGGDKKKKKKLGTSKSSANPLLNSKPVFISKKSTDAKGNPGFRRCHDGRLPIDGFILSTDTDPLASILSQDGKYPPPTIPAGWKSSKAPSNSTSNQTKPLSSAEIAAASKLSPKSRAALLGETPLPGKSVFDYLTPTARSRIATASQNPHLPPALNEANNFPSSSLKTLHSLIPPLPKETALTALSRGTAGWMPYAEDPTKRTRYRSFLEIHAGLRPESTLPLRAPGASNDDWAQEMREFAHAAQIFKPVTGLMATRFTSSSSAPKLASDNVKLEGAAAEDEPLLSKPAEKPKTPAEEAAALGMYGPLTRSVESWFPTRLLCKRFNVKPPAHVQMDPGDAPDMGGAAVGEKAMPTHSTALPQKRLELVGKRDMDDLKMSGGGQGVKGLDFASGDVQSGDRDVVETEVQGLGGGGLDAGVVDVERNEALEKERPGEDIFKAIFGSDSEDD